MRRIRRASNEPKRFAIYLRCSTDDQAQKDFTTIEAQREFNEEHITALGGTVAKVYADEGKSGTNLKRPGFKSMLADAGAGLFDAVCVTYMSRLGRGKQFDIAEYLLKEHGVTVEMVKEKFDEDDFAGQFGKRMTTLMDGVYPMMVSQWTRTKMERMVARGYHCGGNTPFGYTTIDAADGTGFHSGDKQPPKRLVPDTETAECVRVAFSMAGTGNTLTAIRDYLDSVTSRKWTITTVRNLLSSETYKGVQIFGRWRNETGHPAIVTAEQWEAAQNGAKLLAVRHCSHKADDYTFYLRGLLTCPHCGCLYTTRSNHGRSGRVHYYVCQNANRNGECPVTVVNANKLHDGILREIRYAATHRTVMNRLIGGSESWSSPTSDLTTVRGQLGKRKQFVEVQIANFTRAIGEGRALDSLIPALEKAEAEKAALIAQIEEADKAIAASTRKRPTVELVQEAWRNVVELWEDGDIDEDGRQRVMSAYVRKVEVETKELATVEIEATSNIANSMVHVTDKYGSASRNNCN